MATHSRSYVGDLAIASLRIGAISERPHYEQVLHNALLSSPPPYEKRWFGNEFRRLGRDPSWLAGLLVSDANMEGYSARRLWQYAVAIEDKSLSSGMLSHAQDEAKHSRMFGRMLLDTFPQLRSDQVAAQLLSYVPRLHESSTDPKDYWSATPTFEEILNTMIMVNLYEVKALVLGKLLSPVVLAHAPEKNRRRIAKMLEVILADESRHIRYSADFIERVCCNGHKKFVQTAIVEFQSMLNKLTESEIEEDRRSAILEDV